MPIQNAELLAALQDDTIISRAAGAGALDALDALMKVNRTVPDDFRGVILAKKDFWHGFNGMNVDPPKPNDGTFLDDTGGFVGVGANFTVLHKLAVQRRVQAGLKVSGGTLDEPFLVDLINGDEANARTKLATKPAIFGALATLTHPAAWDVNTEDFLTAGAIGEIKTQAKEQLLLNKIKNTRATKDEIEHLIAEAAAGTAQFRVALQAAPWNLTAQTAGNLVAANFTDVVKKAALEKGLALAIGLKSQVDLLNPNTLLTLNKDTANFKNDFGAPYTDVLLGDPEIQKAKEQLGQRFLIAKLSQLDGPRVEHLVALASQGDVGGFITKVGLHNDLAGANFGNPNNFVPHAVTATSLPILRQAAALQALKIKIAQCDDPDTLNALMAATTKEQIKQILTDKPALGFSTSPAFREALDNLSLAQVNDIVAAAHVQKRLLAANTAQLKAFVTSPTAVNDIQAYMGQNISVAMQSKVTTHLTPERITEIREKALLSYAKTELVKPTVIDDGALDNLVQAGSVNGVRDGVRLLMGGNEADGLIVTGGAHQDRGLLQQVRAYAAAEQVYRDSLGLDLSGGGYNTMVGAINDLNGHPPQGHQQALMAVLPPKDKQVLQERLVTSLVNRFPNNRPLSQLTALATAKTDPEFANALRAMGITEHSWVNKDARVRLQAAASEKALTSQINATAQFGAEAHPALLALVKQLPLNKQQELLNTPEVMKALLNVQDAHDDLAKREAVQVVKEILGENIDVEPFVEENYRLHLINQIADPNIARIIAQQSPPLDIDKGKIEQINAALHQPLGNDGVNTIFDNNGGANSNYVKKYRRYKALLGWFPAVFIPLLAWTLVLLTIFRGVIRLLGQRWRINVSGMSVWQRERMY
ncbi:hypothetical protein [Legionella tunisiensis]|uniref:hypothetical protein n=1 Tax=Legionella tunisiensis TaxID=1034944 RepID=UPI00030FB02D|nr:hypothetical protein [Legionella tunisiensis]